MSFANPYNFVKIDEKGIERKKDFLGIGDIGGQFVCRMRFLTNFITAGENTPVTKKQQKINNRFCIQGSSLKGMLRSVTEAISNSCISMMPDQYRYKFMNWMPEGTSSVSGVGYKVVPDERRKRFLEFDQKSLVKKDAFIDSCDNIKGLCMCCSLFGTTAKEDNETETSFTFRGKVRISDALFIGIIDENGNIDRTTGPTVTKYLKNHALSSPKNHHEQFYLDGNRIKGRKFYYHHGEDKLLDSRENDTSPVELIKKDAVFEFTISFENLTKEEYGLILTALELEPGLAHKIGMGKPLGLGSCKIKVIETTEFSKNRYLSITDANACKAFKDDTLAERISLIKDFWKHGIPDDLRCILRVNNGFKVIRYPEKNIHDKSKDEFIIYKNLHPPCSGFSHTEKNGVDITFQSPEKKLTKSYNKKSNESDGPLARAYKKAQKDKKRKENA